MRPLGRLRHLKPLPEAFDRLEFPVLGLSPTWSGRRYIAGWGAAAQEVTNVQLGHIEADGGVLLVTSRRARKGDQFQDVWNSSRGSLDLDVDGVRFVGEKTTEHLRLSVEGQEVDFCWSNGRDGSWMAHGNYGDSHVVLEASGFPSSRLILIRLLTLHDYTAGFLP